MRQWVRRALLAIPGKAGLGDLRARGGLMCKDTDRVAPGAWGGGQTGKEGAGMERTDARLRLCGSCLPVIRVVTSLPEPDSPGTHC